MCNNPITLIFIFILKIIIIISLPLYYIFVKEKRDSVTKTLIFINVIFIILFVLLSIFNNSYMINSSIRGIRNAFNVYKYSDKEVSISNDPSIVEKIITNEFYTTKNDSKVYYFNNNSLPLNNRNFICDGKTHYMKYYGNSVTTASIAISTVLNRNVDPNEILNYFADSISLECNGITNLESVLSVVLPNYNLSYRIINANELSSYLNKGNIVIEKVKYVSGGRNLYCNEGNIIIYDINKNNEYSILSPNDTDHITICSNTTPGFGSYIQSNVNEDFWSFDELNRISEKYIIIERY